MKNITLIIIGVFLLMSTGMAQALSPTGKNQLQMLVQGGPSSMKRVARTIHSSHTADIEVTDMLAELMLTHYKSTEREYVDALAWTAKAFAALGNPRYRDTLKAVLDGDAHKKLKKYTEPAYETLVEKGEAEQYTKGSSDIAAQRKAFESAAPETTAAASASGGAVSPITAAKVGMSMQEVYTLCGEPTSSSSHVTGKAFIPFNFRGADNVRTNALYKGQGRIIFNKTSQYSRGWKVLEVVIDPNEVGYK